MISLTACLPVDVDQGHRTSRCVSGGRRPADDVVADECGARPRLGTEPPYVDCVAGVEFSPAFGAHRLGGSDTAAVGVHGERGSAVVLPLFDDAVRSSSSSRTASTLDAMP